MTLLRRWIRSTDWMRHHSHILPTSKQKIVDGRSAGKIEGKLAVGDVVYPVGSERAGEILVECGQKITKNARSRFARPRQDGRDHGRADAAMLLNALATTAPPATRKPTEDLPAAAARQPTAVGEGQVAVPREVL